MATSTLLRFCGLAFKVIQAYCLIADQTTEAEKVLMSANVFCPSNWLNHSFFTVSLCVAQQADRGDDFINYR